ncbi:Zinc finger and SCAN domain-containing protein 2 [Folsomia candida]|uniref:Zinc finger and SCAN domain-containing protein 2 n=1 Tax=Folsomia candida TaxID=158441 RepID=A0A226E2C7_FOLCA|nr:Zinc finger and SCAN domain-containing protein 2 [Folsomia candida]
MSKILKYHSWNADGITEEKITKMMTHWIKDDAQLIFIQESKLLATEEQKIADFVEQHYGFDSIFHSSIQWKSNPLKSSYGVCVFYKNVKVRHMVLTSSNPNLLVNPERIMKVMVDCDLLDKEILFFNIYFPANNYKRKSRPAEQQKWLTTIKFLCRKHSDEHCIWLGDFNMQKLKPNNKPDGRSNLFDQLQKIIKKYGFRNVADKLWKPNVFTRHAEHPSNKVNHITSTLDYVITSKSIQDLHQTCVPLYDMDVRLSDHIDIKCSNKIATAKDLAMPFLKKIIIHPPVIPNNKVGKLKCDNCGYEPTGIPRVIRKNFKRHVAKCNGPKITLCTDCNTEFGNPGRLALHRARDCPGAPYVTICQDCGKDFKYHSNLVKHRNRVCKGQSPVCLNCNKHCGSMTGLASHVRGGC